MVHSRAAVAANDLAESLANLAVKLVPILPDGGAVVDMRIFRVADRGVVPTADHQLHRGVTPIPIHGIQRRQHFVTFRPGAAHIARL